MMANTANRLDRRKARVTARAIAERRRHRRVAPALRAGALYNTGREVIVEIIDISVGGLSACATTPPRENSRIVLLVDVIGRVEGVVTRVDGERFCVRFNPVTLRRRNRLADQLAWEVNQTDLGLIDDRHAPRHMTIGPALVVLEGGVSHAQRIDESDVGASFAATDRPLPGTRARVDARPGRVARNHARGFAVAFDVARPSSLNDARRSAS